MGVLDRKVAAFIPPFISRHSAYLSLAVCSPAARRINILGGGGGGGEGRISGDGSRPSLEMHRFMP